MKKTKQNQRGIAFLPLLAVLAGFGGSTLYIGAELQKKHDILADKSTSHHIVVGQGN